MRRLPLLVASVLACRSEAPPVESKTEAVTEGALEKKPAVDQKIESAMASARQSATPGQGSQSGGPAPPADGLMSAEAAAKELAPGAPATLVLGSEGAAPRLKIGVDRVLGAGPSGKLEVSYRSGGSVMPTIELELKTKVSAAEVAPGSEATAFVTRYLVSKARPSEQQPGRLPENARAEISKIDGSAIDFVTTPKGAALGARHQVAGNNRDLEPLVMGSAEALAITLLPYPDVPVGVGAFWMVKSRETANGADVLAYRMVRVTDLSGDTLKLSVSTRRYLLSESLSIQGFPPNRVRQFQSEGEGSLSLQAGAAYPQAAEVHDTFMALVTPNDRPSQALPVQSELTAKLAFSK